MRLIALTACAVLLAGCGEEEQPAQPATATNLVVEVRPEGPDGPTERRTVTQAPPGLTARDLAPTPRDRACTEIYGGPQTASVVGVLRGEPVDARFSRQNGCEIARWERAEPLLGAP